MASFASVAPKRLALLVASLLVVVIVRLLLTFASHRAVLRLMPRGRSRTAPPAMALRIADSVRASSRWVPAASCLTQALAAQYLLALRGYASDLKIGVKKAPSGAVEAHAWLLSGNRIVTGGTAAEIHEYVPLADLPLR